MLICTNHLHVAVLLMAAAHMVVLMPGVLQAVQISAVLLDVVNAPSDCFSRLVRRQHHSNRHEQHRCHV